MSAEVPKTIKFVIRDRFKTEFSKRGNIFEDRQEKGEDILESYDSEYLIVGDGDFKNRYYTQKKRQRNKTMGEKHLSEEDTIFQTTLDQKNKISFYSSLHPNNDQQNSNIFQMQKRTLIKFQNQKNRQNKINKYLTNKLSHKLNKKIDSTLAYSTRKVQIFPNADLDSIISDNIPQYWQQSLRINNKRLMKHIEGNPYSKNTQQFMFQTIKGRKCLQESIPLIKLDFVKSKKSRAEEPIDVKGYKVRRNKYQVDSLSIKNDTKETAKLACQQFLKVSFNNSYRY